MSEAEEMRAAAKLGIPMDDPIDDARRSCFDDMESVDEAKYSRSVRIYCQDGTPLEDFCRRRDDKGRKIVPEAAFNLLSEVLPDGAWDIVIVARK